MNFLKLSSYESSFAGSFYKIPYKRLCKIILNSGILGEGGIFSTFEGLTRVFY